MITLLIVSIIAISYILISKFYAKKSSGLDAHPTIETIQLKNSTRLVVHVPLEFNLILTKTTNWTRALEKTPFFRLAKTGDSEFDQFFVITAYRDDVISVIRQNAGLRKLLLELAKGISTFASISYSHKKLSLSLNTGSISGNELANAVRGTFAATYTAMLTPFEHLLPDNDQQTRRRLVDTWLPNLPLITFVAFLVLTLVGGRTYQPLASGELPYNFALIGGVLFFVFHLIILFGFTKQASVRLQGMSIAIITAVVCTITTLPEIAVEINAQMQQKFVEETVEIVGFDKVTPRKRAHEYYILLASTPNNISAGREHSMPALEVSYNLYLDLQKRTFNNYRQLKVVEAIGLLGLPVVVSAVPL